MNYEQELKERKPYFNKWLNLKGALVYYIAKNDKIILFELKESSFNFNLDLIMYNGLQLRPQEIKIADKEIIKKYVEQETAYYQSKINDLKERYKAYLKESK